MMASFSSDSIGYHETNDKEVTVKLPDLFHSFLKNPPVLNPHYEEIGKESEKWLSRLLFNIHSIHTHNKLIQLIRLQILFLSPCYAEKGPEM
jgi:hypothetical protein